MIFDLPRFPRLVFLGDLLTSYISLMSCLQTQHILRRGGEAFLAYVRVTGQEVKLEEEKVEGIRAVRDFSDVFSEDFPRLPPEWKIEFTIDLVPDTESIFKAPYRMALAEIKKLKEQLQDLLDKGFIHPSVSPWGLRSFLLRKRMVP